MCNSSQYEKIKSRYGTIYMVAVVNYTFRGETWCMGPKNKGKISIQNWYEYKQCLAFYTVIVYNLN